MATYTFNVVRGRTFKWAGQVMTLGVGEDLTGDDMKFVVKHDLTDADADKVFQCSKVATDGIAFTTPAIGEFTLTIADTKTSALDATREPIYLKYELIFLPSTGEKYSLVEGDFIVHPRAIA